MLFSAFPVKERGAAFGLFGISLVMAPALGPLISGLFVEFFDWRLIFLINIPIGILGVYQGNKMLKERKGEGKQRFDRLGIIFSVLAFGLLLYGFSIAEKDGWGSTPVLLSLVIGGIALVIFAVVELRRPDGLVDLKLFRKPLFLIGNIVGWVSVIALFGAEFLLPLYLQSLRGLNALETGFLLLPLAITAGLVVPFAGKLSDKIGARPLAITGFLLLLLNTWQLSNLALDTNLVYIGFLLALRGAALGLVVQITQQVALRDIEPGALPRASSLVNSSRLIFQSMGVALLATLISITTGPRPEFSQGAQPDPAQLLAFQESFLRGLENAYAATFWVGIVAVILSLFLPGWPVARKASLTPETLKETRSFQKEERERAA
jgi:DHA2 family multidrug resistance protein